MLDPPSTSLLHFRWPHYNARAGGAAHAAVLHVRPPAMGCCQSIVVAPGRTPESDIKLPLDEVPLAEFNGRYILEEEALQRIAALVKGFRTRRFWSTQGKPGRDGLRMAITSLKLELTSATTTALEEPNDESFVALATKFDEYKRKTREFSMLGDPPPELMLDEQMIEVLKHEFGYTIGDDDETVSGVQLLEHVTLVMQTADPLRDSARSVRERVEDRLGRPRDSLKRQKRDIGAIINKIMIEPAAEPSAQLDQPPIAQPATHRAQSAGHVIKPGSAASAVKATPLERARAGGKLTLVEWLDLLASAASGELLPAIAGGAAPRISKQHKASANGIKPAEQYCVRFKAWDAGGPPPAEPPMRLPAAQLPDATSTVYISHLGADERALCKATFVASARREAEMATNLAERPRHDVLLRRAALAACDYIDEHMSLDFSAELMHTDEDGTGRERVRELHSPIGFIREYMRADDPQFYGELGLTWEESDALHAAILYELMIATYDTNFEMHAQLHGLPYVPFRGVFLRVGDLIIIINEVPDRRSNSGPEHPLPLLHR